VPRPRPSEREIANLRPIVEGTTGKAHPAFRHGARSETEIVRVARAQKRRFLARNGLRARDLDGLAAALLDNWARAQSKVELLDQFFASRGFLDEDGVPQPAVAVYFTALNSARVALSRLSEVLRNGAGIDPVAVLEAQGREIRITREGS